MQSIKEHNLKANHNMAGHGVATGESVCNLSKNTIWKQITTLCSVLPRTRVCMQSIKEHNLKANHNGYWRYFSWWISVCNLSKNTIWKQITTNLFGGYGRLCLYAIYQRTQSESKSQQADVFGLRAFSVCNLSKNTIWKQITTPVNHQYGLEVLYAIYQRTQSESKSQQLNF